jgi:hypothetical protein
MRCRSTLLCLATLAVAIASVGCPGTLEDRERFETGAATTDAGATSTASTADTASSGSTGGAPGTGGAAPGVGGSGGT